MSRTAAAAEELTSGLGYVDDERLSGLVETTRDTPLPAIALYEWLWARAEYLEETRWFRDEVANLTAQAAQAVQSAAGLLEEAAALACKGMGTAPARTTAAPAAIERTRQRALAGGMDPRKVELAGWLTQLGGRTGRHGA